METLFPRTFLLVFVQLAVGGMFCLSIPPFHEMDRGYYKSSAFVFWAIGSLATIGNLLLWLRPDTAASSGISGLEIIAGALFSTLGAGYLFSLWYEFFVVRAWLFVATWLSGFLALIVSALTFAAAGTVPLGLVLYPTSFVLAALVLGTAASGMLLGHWYLIDHDLSLTPLWNVLRFYLICLAVQTAALGLGALVIGLAGGSSPLSDYGIVFLGRAAISPLGTLALAAMIWRTLLIPQTMAATGLFYIAILAATVGELIGRYLLFRTGLPL